MHPENDTINCQVLQAQEGEERHQHHKLSSYPLIDY